MNLPHEFDTLINKGTLTTKFHVPTVCFTTFSLTADGNGVSANTQLTADYIKNLVSKLDKLEDEGKTDEVNQLEWAATLQILQYIETLHQKIDPALALNIVNTAFKRLKFITEKRTHVNLGHFLVISELVVKFFHDIEDYKADEHKVKQKVLEQASWLLKNIEAVAASGEEMTSKQVSFQGLATVDVIKLYFKNLTKLINAHNNMLKQQNKVLQKKAFNLLQKYKYDADFTNICIELIATLTQALSGPAAKSTLDTRLKLYFSNFVYLFDIFNPRKDKDGIINEFSYDQVFFLKDEPTTPNTLNLNTLFPYKELVTRNTRVPLQEASFFAKTLYELIVKAVNEVQKDELINVNIFYNLKAMERVLMSDTEQLKSKKKTYDVEKGLSLEDYIKFSAEHKALCLKLIQLLVTKFKGYIVKNLDWITNAIYYLFVNFKEDSYLLRKVVKTVEVLVSTLGKKTCSFARFLFFKGGNLFEIYEKLFVSLFVTKEGTAPLEEIKVTHHQKKGQNKKKKGSNVGFGELRLQLTEQNVLAFMESFSKKDSHKLFTRLTRVLIAYLYANGKQELDIDVVVKIDNFAEMAMNVSLKSFGELKTSEVLLIVSLLAAIGLNNINNKQESMVNRGILNYLKLFSSHYTEQTVQDFISEVREKLLAFHSNKTALVMEYESLEDIYAYYDNKIKIMNSLDKRKLEELNREELEDDDEETGEKLVKRVDRKDDTEIHNEIYAARSEAVPSGKASEAVPSGKASLEKSNKATPVQQDNHKMQEEVSARNSSKKATPVQHSQAAVSSAHNSEQKKDSYFETIKEIASKKVTPFGVQDEVTTIKAGENVTVEETTSVLQKESGEIVVQQIHTQVVQSPNDEVVVEEREVVVIGGSDDEDIGSMPQLNLEDDPDM